MPISITSPHTVDTDTNVVISSKVEKVAPVDDDLVLIEDSENALIQKKVKISNLPDEIVVINTKVEKVAPVDDDLVLIEDSEDSNARKKVKIVNLPGKEDVGNVDIAQKSWGTNVGYNSDFAEHVGTTHFGAALKRIETTPLINGNVFILYRYDDTGWLNKFAIYDKDGLEVVAPTAIESSEEEWSDMTTLLNGNVVIVGAILGATNVGKFKIYDQDGNMVKAITDMGTISNRDSAISTLSNGNFVVAYPGVANGEFMIFDKDGVVVKTATTIRAGAIEDIEVTTLTNGNFVVAYTVQPAKGAATGYFTIYDQDGVEVKAEYQFHANRPAELTVKSLKNGNFLLASIDYDNDEYGKFQIYNQDGIQVKAATTFNTTLSGYFDASILNDGNILIAYLGAGDIGAYKIYSQDGELLKDATTFNVAMETSGGEKDLSTVVLPNGNFVIAHTSDETTLYGSIVIHKQNGFAVNSPPGFLLTTKGDLHGFSTTDFIIPVGAEGQVLSVSSAADGGLAWTTNIAVGVELANDTWITGRNFADGADLNMWKINTDDFLESGVETVLIDKLVMSGAITGGTNLDLSGHLYLPLHDDASTPTINFGDDHDGIYSSADGNLDFATNGAHRMNISNDGLYVVESIWLGEQVNAKTDVSGLGQIWVKTGTPNTLWFTDDAGTDAQLGSGSSLDGLTSDATGLYPDTSNTRVLGTSTKMFSDLYLASGGIINWNNANMKATHSADKLTFTGSTRQILQLHHGNANTHIIFGASSESDVHRPGGLTLAMGDLGFIYTNSTSGTTNRFIISHNLYNSSLVSTNYRVIDAPASKYVQINGAHIFQGDSIGGTAYGAISLVSQMTLTATGEARFYYPMAIKESASASADIATYGQLWVKTGTPNTLWFTDSAGTDFILNGGAEDSGVATLWDMSVSATPALGTEQSANIKIDGNIILKAYAEADSAGSIQNKKFISYADFWGLERSVDPSEPAEGEYVIWMSDGTGKGDDGDVLIASQAGGVTKYNTLLDHSAGLAW